jgi:EcsC protein family
MAKLSSMRRGSLVGRGFNRVLRYGIKRGLHSIAVEPEDFRKRLADKHALWVPNFSRMHDVPLERLDEIARELIGDAGRLAFAEGAGFGLGGMVTLLPDISLLTAMNDWNCGWPPPPLPASITAKTSRRNR